MDSKETKINDWLDSRMNEYDNDPYYIENCNDNYNVCDVFITELVETVKRETFTIKNENEFRDDVIELLYKYSNERLSR
jgi:hypothetical protein